MFSNPRKFALAASAAFLAGMAVPFVAVGQEFPTKPIRLVVPESPGSTPDTSSRVVAPEMAKVLGQPVVVENKPGAAQMIGLEYVAKQMPADGYTLAAVSVSSLGILPLTVKEMHFDPLNDLPPVIGLAEGRLVFGVSAKMPWKSFNELVSAAKASPGKYNYGSSNSIVQLASEALIRGLGLNIMQVPYSGTGPYFLALTSGEAQMGFVSVASATTLEGKFRVLAVTGDQRREPLNDVPTFPELGMPQIRGLGYSLNVRVGTPRAAIDKLYRAASAALKQPEVRAFFAKTRLDIVDQSPEVAAKRLADEAKLFADIAKQIGLKPQ